MKNLINKQNRNIVFLFFLLCLTKSIDSYSKTYTLSEDKVFDDYGEWIEYWGETLTSNDKLEIREYKIEINFDFPVELEGINFENEKVWWGDKGTGTNIIIGGKVKINFITNNYFELKVKEKGEFEILNDVNQSGHQAKIIVKEGGKLIFDKEFSYSSSGDLFEISGDVIIHEDLSLSGSNVIININETGFLEVLGGFSNAGSGKVLNISGDVIIHEEMSFINHKPQININETGSLEVRGNFSYNQSGEILNISGDVIIHKNFSCTNSGVIVNVNKTGTLEVINDVTFTNGGGVTFNICGLMIVRGNLDLNQGILIDLTCGCPNFDEEVCECVGEPDWELGRLIIEGGFDYNCGPGNNTIIGACNMKVEGECNDCEGSANDLCKDIDLPITLLYFRGENTSQGNLLSWKTGMEQNTSHFDIEGSNNKTQWSVLGTVQAAGNSNTPLVYNYLDSKMTHKYYRLAQYDLDQTVSYYGVVSINNDGLEFTVNVYPNELTNGEELFIQISGANINYPVEGVFYSTDGKVVGFQEISNGEEGLVTKSIMLPKSNSGVLLLKISNGRNGVTKKLLIH